MSSSSGNGGTGIAPDFVIVDRVPVAGVAGRTGFGAGDAGLTGARPTLQLGQTPRESSGSPHLLHSGTGWLELSNGDAGGRTALAMGTGFGPTDGFSDLNFSGASDSETGAAFPAEEPTADLEDFSPTPLLPVLATGPAALGASAGNFTD